MGTTTAKAQDETAVHGSRVLVAEDDESFRGFVSQALTWSGYRVETSTNGSDVLARLARLADRNELPDLVLTDVQMPGTDGLNLLREARERWPSLPVILMTCYGDHEVLREALRIGCHGFIDKPFTVHELDQVIAKTLEEAKRLQASLGGTNDWRTSSGRFRMPEERERIGNYEILEEIARGAMGVVYKARQAGLDRLVALKVTRQGVGDGSFLREARAMARLRHPSIAVVHEVGSEEGIEYFTMEFLDGCSLGQRLRQEPMSPREVVDVLAPVADGLAHVHAFDILHRDVKPSNILISGGVDGAPVRSVLVDFGIATDKREEGVEPEGYLEGTLNYMAPEYAEGAAYDELCDIYSFGVVIYEALAGRGKLPHWQPQRVLPLDPVIGPHILVQRFRQAEYRPIEDLVEGIGPALAAVVKQATAKDRAQRYASARELADALRAALPPGA